MTVDKTGKITDTRVMSGIDHLLTLADHYARAASVELSTVSWRVFGDTKKIGALGRGSDIQVRRQEKALRWFSENWPEGAEWPPNVPRPAPAEGAAA